MQRFERPSYFNFGFPHRKATFRHDRSDEIVATIGQKKRNTIQNLRSVDTACGSASDTVGGVDCLPDMM
jgi:hypothetical protein